MASQARIEPIQRAQPDRTAAFAERMVGVVNDGCLALMVSVGHRTGLFETRLASRTPARSRARWPEFDVRISVEASGWAA